MPSLLSQVTKYPVISRKKIIQSFDLESKSGSPDSLVTEILSWTGQDALLIRYLCQIITDANYFIPSGMEAALVEKLVKERVIPHWKNHIIADSLNQIQKYFFTQDESFSKRLLQLYLKIWQEKLVTTNHSLEIQQLIALGLVIKQSNQLKVANRLYYSIFNGNWVKQQLSILEKLEKIRPPNPKTANLPLSKNDPFAKIVAVVILLALLLIAPLVLLLNNSPSQVSPKKEIESQSIPQ